MDDILVKKAVKGDQEAFMKLIDGLMLQMYKVAKSRLSDEDSIGDAIQETILAAFKNIKKLKNIEFFNTWLIKILINKCNDIMKDRKIDYIDDYNKLSEEKFLQIDKSDEDIDFEKTLDILPKDYRVMVVMYYVNRFTTKEISEILGEKEGTIKSRLSRGREKLRHYYIKENII